MRSLTCQDTDYIVRVSMCQQLPEIGKGVGPETTVSVLLPEVFELTRDEEPTVRAAALTCLVRTPLTSSNTALVYAPP